MTCTSKGSRIEEALLDAGIVRSGPVLYATFVLDLKLVRWEEKRKEVAWAG